ncbi:SapC family protein [Colwellia psychrerythraea]|uniref:SapC family protein n=1 Tax=Colwellia psychrerythraea (strain 34H / ATCC BAA-681) TaxID=167879 RepID=Q487J2_COLP3|nr:SapC family protein [Colwellia psychrerythraea]AAZ24821.1 hypothetical protein CPS_1024 [Colwellia psychrerythraea 34H]
MASIKAINNSAHGNVKVKSNPSFIQSKTKHFAPVVVQEFISASKEFPIVFIKDAETGRFNAVVLLGLKPQENLFFDEKSWQGSYIPEALTLYPFVIHQAEGSDKALLCVDEDSALVNETIGDAFFDEKGVQKEWLTAKGEAVVDYVNKSGVTQNFIQLLLAKELLAPQTLSLNLAGQEEYTLDGLYVINEQKLNDLSDSEFSELRKTNALPAIYAILMSMQCIKKLIDRQSSK